VTLADIVDPATRSRMMGGIRSKNTKPELALRRAMHARGFRFRLHPRNVPGKPDLALARYRAAIFVHGCFWHRHKGCQLAATPASNPEFWSAKFRRNVERDAEVRQALLAAGWRVAVVWECALRWQPVELAADAIAAWPVAGDAMIELPDVPTRRAKASSSPGIA
jgi:DNA mismatch endonuclease, patch repair protein